MGARLASSIDVPAPLLEARTPSMMLATLVENAVKHGIGPLAEGGAIRIAAAREGETLVLSVADTGTDSPRLPARAWDWPTYGRGSPRNTGSGRRSSSRPTRRAASSLPSGCRGPAKSDHEQRASCSERRPGGRESRMVQRVRQAPPRHRSRLLRRGSRQRILFKLAVEPASHSGAVVGEVIACFVIGLAAMLSVVATDNRLAGVLGPGARMAIAVLVAAAAGTVLMEAVTQLLIRPLGLPFEEAEMMMYSGELHRFAYRFSGAATSSLMLIALYAMLEASRRATEDLHAVRVRRSPPSATVLEGDLRAMQARVDPDLLFDTLLAVDRAYAGSIRSGEEALDALSGFLRAALPAEAVATSPWRGARTRARLPGGEGAALGVETGR